MDPTPRLRILHYLPTVRLAEGGIARAVLDWCTVLAQRGHQVTLLTGVATDAPDWSQPGSPKLVNLIRPTGFLDLLPPAALEPVNSLLDEVDVIHLHAPWLASNIQIARRAKARNIPYVLTVHGMLDDWSMAQSTLKKKLYLRFFGEHLLNDASTLHFTALEERRQAEPWFSNPNTAVVPILFDTKPFETLPGPHLAERAFPALLRPEPKLLFLSRLHSKKGVDLLIESVGLLRDRQESVQLIIAGDGDEAYKNLLATQVESLRLQDRITFVGMVTGELKLSLYQSADLFVLPTSQENFGLVFPEALACEAPVVTTRGVDIWEELTEAGAIISDRTSEAIAEAIHASLTDPIGLQGMGERGRAWVFEKLNSDRVAQQYETLYARAAGKA